MAENSSISSSRTSFRASATRGTPPDKRRGLVVRWILALIILGIFAWSLRGQIGNLVFARGGSSTRPTGEWVGKMEIIGQYDVATRSVKAFETQHSSAAVYVNLHGTDSFMNEYGGPGELILAGDTSPRPLHVGAFRLEDSGRIHGAFDVDDLVGGAEGKFTGDKLELRNYTTDFILFTLEMHRGTRQDFEAIAARLNDTR